MAMMMIYEQKLVSNPFAIRSVKTSSFGNNNYYYLRDHEKCGGASETHLKAG